MILLWKADVLKKACQRLLIDLWSGQPAFI
jgi:hypothetical protein